jgi:hypothetical protein
MRGEEWTIWRNKWSTEDDKEMSLKMQTVLKKKLLTERDLKLQDTHPSW